MEQTEKLTFRKIIEKLETMPIYWYVPLAYLTLAVLYTTIDYLLDFLNIPDTMVNSQNIPNTTWLKFLFVVIIGPFLETFLCQTIPFYLLGLFQFFRRNYWITIVVASLLFGIAHDFYTQYSIRATIFGFFLISTYFIRVRKNDSFQATFLLHALFNGVAVTVSLFL